MLTSRSPLFARLLGTHSSFRPAFPLYVAEEAFVPATVYAENHRVGMFTIRLVFLLCFFSLTFLLGCSFSGFALLSDVVDSTVSHILVGRKASPVESTFTPIIADLDASSTYQSFSTSGGYVPLFIDLETAVISDNQLDSLSACITIAAAASRMLTAERYDASFSEFESYPAGEKMLRLQSLYEELHNLHLFALTRELAVHADGDAPTPCFPFPAFVWVVFVSFWSFFFGIFGWFVLYGCRFPPFCLMSTGWLPT